MPTKRTGGTREIANPRTKKRTKGDRVIVTPAGKPYGRKFTGSRPIGLTQEQFDQNPTAAATAGGRKTPLRAIHSKKDDLTAPYGARQRRRTKAEK